MLKKSIPAGECVLAEAPVCWWVDCERQDECCARCLKCDLPLGGFSGCQSCRTAVWCSAECKAEDEARHASVCGMLCAAAKHADPDGGRLGADALNLLHFCTHAIALRTKSPAEFERLMGISSAGVVLTPEESEECVRVTARLAAAGVASTPAEPLLRLVESLCKKDKASNFCLAMPPSEKNDDSDDSDDSDDDDDEDDDDDDDDDDDGDKGDVHLTGGWAMATRRVRGYGCYPTLAFCNHSCLPTAARFDALDDVRAPDAPPHPILSARLDPAACSGALATELAKADGSAATAALQKAPFCLATRFVALHALPAGSELTISYMPLSDELSERRSRLREEYCFECDCPRCAVELADEAEHGGAHGGAHDHDHEHAHEHEHGAPCAGQQRTDRAAQDGAAHSHSHSDAERVYSPNEPQEEGGGGSCDHDHSGGDCCGGDDASPKGPASEEAAAAAAAGVDLTYVSLYVLKHVCGECLGTMAPVPGQGADAPCVCNRCGATRTQAEFLERVEEHFNDGESEDEEGWH